MGSLAEFLANYMRSIGPSLRGCWCWRNVQGWNNSSRLFSGWGAEVVCNLRPPSFWQSQSRFETLVARLVLLGAQSASLLHTNALKKMCFICILVFSLELQKYSSECNFCQASLKSVFTVVVPVCSCYFKRWELLSRVQLGQQLQQENRKKIFLHPKLVKSFFLFFFFLHPLKRFWLWYLLCFAEDVAAGAPADGGSGISRRLAGQSYLLRHLWSGLVHDVGDLRLDWKKTRMKTLLPGRDEPTNWSHGERSSLHHCKRVGLTQVQIQAVFICLLEDFLSPEVE